MERNTTRNLSCKQKLFPHVGVKMACSYPRIWRTGSPSHQVWGFYFRGENYCSLCNMLTRQTHLPAPGDFNLVTELCVMGILQP